MRLYFKIRRDRRGAVCRWPRRGNWRGPHRAEAGRWWGRNARSRRHLRPCRREPIEFRAHDHQVKRRFLDDPKEGPLVAGLGEGEAIEPGLRERLPQTRADHPVVQGQQRPYGAVISHDHETRPDRWCRKPRHREGARAWMSRPRRIGLPHRTAPIRPPGRQPRT
jgi:hypothetical protein